MGRDLESGNVKMYFLDNNKLNTQITVIDDVPTHAIIDDVSAHAIIDDVSTHAAIDVFSARAEVENTSS